MPDYTKKQSASPQTSGPVQARASTPGKRTLVELAATPVVQQRTTGATDEAGVHAAAARGTQTPASPLPFADTIQRAFGRHDVSSIQAHTGPDAAASAREMGADAYATQNHVVLGHGNDLHTVAHEAAHVVQQRGGVQLKGGVGQVGDAYERHADEVADAVVQGKSAEGLLDRHAGGSGGASTTVQRRMGAEAEMKMPVTDASGNKMIGDFKLVNHEYFTLVTDKRKGYSNLEIVMKPFDQLAGTDEEANADLDRRLNAMKALIDEIYSAQGPTPISNLSGYGTTLTNPHDPVHAAAEHGLAGGAKIDPTVAAYNKDGAREDNKIMVHYTIGFPIAKMYDAMELVAQDGYDIGKAKPKTFALDARTVADQIATQLGTGLTGAQRDELKGAVALLHSQVAAFAAHTEAVAAGGESKAGQIKNKAALLSRVNLADIYQELSPPVRNLLATPDNQEIVINAMAEALDAHRIDYGDNDVRQIDGLPPTTLAAYAGSAMGGPGVDQQQVFGGTNLTGMDAQGGGGRKVPVEMRSMFSQFRTWEEFVADAKQLVAESRRLMPPPAPSASTSSGAVRTQRTDRRVKPY
ncbi:MAG TPA: DUF4157 domain-containing protein [Kofleriaceae bacterium]|nr:DUF4157 domain-containing protein [Kofleriaceae bacterium]